MSYKKHFVSNDIAPSEMYEATAVDSGTDTISRAKAIDEIKEIYEWHDNVTKERIIEHFKQLPPAQPEQLSTNLASLGTDCISRQSAIDAFNTNLNELVVGGEENAKTVENYLNRVLDKIKCLPSAQPERTCVNCGRTVNNGGWYADGRTRCPIEEHYALPKDGYCHLWEKRNVTDDDYPERREE